MKTDWKRPEIIILSRGEPEEAVLFGCKKTTVNITPDSGNRDCQGRIGGCGACREITGS